MHFVVIIPDNYERIREEASYLLISLTPKCDGSFNKDLYT